MKLATQVNLTGSSVCG